MASYTITTTAGQDEALQRRVDQINAERALAPPPLPPITPADYIQSTAGTLLDQAVRSDELDLVERAKRGQMLTEAEKARVRAALGV